MVDENIEYGLKTTQDAKFYAVTSRFTPFSNANQDLVVQFSVKLPDQEEGYCGGAYIKILPGGFDEKEFNGDSDYHIMFGPDICGYDTSKIQLIFNFKGENLIKDDDIKLEYEEKDESTHLYTLIVRPDNSYTVLFDEKEKAHGLLHEDWDFPQKQVGDPTDLKPEDWIDEELIDDPSDEKPADWDAMPEYIPDPEAERPEDWDEEDDGEWEAPMVTNPNWKGEWKPQKIKNPLFKGPWIQRLIDNPSYVEEVYRYESIGGVGIDVWQVNSGSVFDNFYIGNSVEEAQKYAKDSFGKIKDLEGDARQQYKDDKRKDAAEGGESGNSKDDL